MALTEHGISTTRTPRTFRYEWFNLSVTGARRVQWDYRDTKGTLYSGIAKSIEEAKSQAARQSGEDVR